MGTVNVTLGEDTRLNLILGQQLENAVTSVVFDFSAWQTTYGAGTLALSVQRPGDEMPYAVTLTTSGTNATWSVTNLDTAYKGVGHIQLTYTVGSAIKKSVVYKFTVYESLGANGEYPSPGQTWQEEMEDELAGVKADLNLSHTVNLFDPINKSGTVDGITYTFKNGTLRMQGTKTGWVVLQTLNGNINDVFTLSSMARSAKPSIYIRNGDTNVATFASADGYVAFTMPATSVNISAYVSGTFDYTFSLTLVKDEIPSFPLLLHENGENTILNFADCTYEAIGDSLTYGFTGSWDQGQQIRVNTPYPDVVKNILGFKTALNKGETGTTIANDLDKMGTYYPISNDNRLNGYSYAQVISIMGGTNDYDKGTTLGTVYDSFLDNTFHAGWKRILNNLSGRFSQYDAFIFVIIPPVTQAVWTDNSAGHKWIDYIEATEQECRNFGIPILDMSTMGRISHANKTTYTSDGIHFNQKYISRIFAPMVADFIKRNCH